MILSFALPPPAAEEPGPAASKALTGGAMGFYRALLAELHAAPAAPANENRKDARHDHD